ncbi:Hemolysin [Ceratobasidium theobromae]|uniref:Hemolysin n=1 Tax=Ceratobasidium theobromae TaxID=1582974 RepID=A0A5N5QMJ9_9AGAM|nr:Hemolysin [Ceratobasidium theobromae]
MRSNRTIAAAMLIISRAAHASPIFVLTKKEPEAPIGSPEFWWRMVMSMGLVLLGGAFAGLTLGLMGLDELHLRVLAASSDNPKERNNAKKVLRLMKKGRHWVLVVLLLGNVIVNESLPIFLDSAIGGGIAAVVISTVMIVIFGIIPQAACARYGLQIGAMSAPLVLSLMYIFAPIAWPIAKLLDWALGNDETNTYKKAELKSFLQFHREGQEPLRDDEASNLFYISILNGVLSLNDKKVSEIMTPIQDVMTLSNDTILDHNRVDVILTSGYSRIPIHEVGNRTSFVGLLLVKKVGQHLAISTRSCIVSCMFSPSLRLLAYDPAQQLPVNAFSLSILPEAEPSISCFQALDYFQTGRSHLLLISENPGEPEGALGVITLEDIIEEIISEEIVDETDRYEDNRHKRRAKRQSTAAIMRGIVEREKRRWSFNDGATTDNDTSSYSTSRVPTPKPTTPGREAAEVTRLLPIDEHATNGYHEDYSSYGSTTHSPSLRGNGVVGRGRERNRSQSGHQGLYTDSPTRT